MRNGINYALMLAFLAAVILLAVMYGLGVL